MKLRMRNLVVSIVFLGVACATAVTLVAPSSSSPPSAPEPTVVQVIPTADAKQTLSPAETRNPAPTVPTSTTAPDNSASATIIPVPEPTTSLVPTPESAETSKSAPIQILTPEVVAQAEPEFEDAISAIFRELNPDGPKSVNQFRYQQLLPQDAIQPIYEPAYLSARRADLDPEDLIIGVSIAGEHRAYPIRTLRFNEMANDELGGVPILVTW